MDPDKALEELRERVSAALMYATENEAEALELARRFRTLDNWITKGGFLPAEWRPK